MAWTTPRTWVAGEKPTAATYNTHVRDNLLALGGAATSYTPTLTNVTLGTGGTVVGAWSGGKNIDAIVVITLGTSGVLTGTASFTLPAPPAAAVPMVFPLGIVSLVDSSSGAVVYGVARWTGTDVAVSYNNATPTTSLSVNATTPWTWAVGDKIIANLAYPAA